MNKNLSLLSLAITSAILTTACGGGGGSGDSASDTPQPSQTSMTVQVIDGYLQNAKVCVDFNSDYSCDTDKVTTDALGKATLKVDSDILDKYVNPRILAKASSDTVINYSDNSTSRKLDKDLVLASTIKDLSKTQYVNVFSTMAIAAAQSGSQSSEEASWSDLENKLNTSVSNIQNDYTSNKKIAAIAESLVLLDKLPKSENELKSYQASETADNLEYAQKIAEKVDSKADSDDYQKDLADFVDVIVKDEQGTTPDKITIDSLSLSCLQQDAGLTVKCTSTVKVSDNSAVEYFWDFGDGETSDQANPTHTFKEASEKTIALIVNSVSDKTIKKSSSTKVSVDYANTAPVAKIKVSSTNVEVNTEITFDASESSDAENDKLTYKWFIGDEEVSTAQTFKNSFNEAGVYAVSLVVSDGKLSSQKVTQNIVVTASSEDDYKYTISCDATSEGEIICENKNDTTKYSSYYWYVSDVSASSKLNENAKLSYKPSKSGEYSVTLFLLDDNNKVISNVTEQVSVEVPIVYVEPKLDFSCTVTDICNSQEFVCKNKTVADKDNPIVSYSWLVDGNNVATTKDLTYKLDDSKEGKLVSNVTLTAIATDSKKYEINSKSVEYSFDACHETPDINVEFNCKVSGEKLNCSASEDLVAKASSFAWTLANGSVIGKNYELSYTPSNLVVGNNEVCVNLTATVDSKDYTGKESCSTIVHSEVINECKGDECSYSELKNSFEDIPLASDGSNPYRIYLKASSSNAPYVYAYASSTQFLGAWPGTVMKEVSGISDLWYIDLPETVSSSAEIIFNTINGNVNNRYPADGKGGVAYTSDFCFDFANTSVLTKKACGIQSTDSSITLSFSKGSADSVTDIRELVDNSGEYLDTALFISNPSTVDKEATGTYSINGVYIGKFKNGQVLRIGENVVPTLDNPVDINVTITADSDSSKSATAKFRKLKYQKVDNPYQEAACVSEITSGDNQSSSGETVTISTASGSYGNKLACYKGNGEESCNLRIYQVMVESFQDGDPSRGYGVGYGTSSHNGDLRGIINAIPYIKALGANAIWLTPIFNSCDGTGSGCSQLDATGYFTKDYFKIDGHFGSIEDFEELVETVHKNNMYIFLDGVFGHFKAGVNTQSDNGSTLITTSTCYGSGMSTYKSNCADWTNSNTENFYKDVATYWIKKYKIDGWRLDQAYQVNPVEKWANVRKAVESAAETVTYTNGNGDTVHPLGYMVGELWEGNANIQKYGFGPSSNPGLKSNFDFNMRYALVQALAVEESGKKDHSGTRLLTQYSENENDFASHAMPNLMITNHDLVRFGDLLQRGSIAEPSADNYWALHRLAFAFQAAYSGPITVYYGDEIGQEVPNFSTKKNADGYYDDHVSRDNGRISGFNSNEQALHDYVAKLLAIRAVHPALHNGAMTPIYADTDLFVIRKHNSDDNVLFAMNLSGNSKTLKVSASIINAKSTLTDAVTGKRYTANNGVFTVPLNAYSSGFLVVDAKDSDLLCTK